MSKRGDLGVRIQAVYTAFIEKKKYAPAIEDLLKIQDEYGTSDVIIYYLGVCYSNLRQYDKAIDCLEFVFDSEDLSMTQIIQTNMLLGFIFTEKEALDKAEMYFKEVLEINSQSSTAHSALGFVYFLSKRYDLAIVHFKRSIQIDPNNSSGHNNLGYTYTELGINLNEAMTECRKAVALSPKSAAYRDSLGWVLFALGKYPDAVKEFEQALHFPCSHQQVIYDHLNLAIKKRDQKK